MVTRPCQRRANGLSAPPPADRRGIAGGGAYPRCRGEPAGRERLILWKTKRKRKRMDDFVTEFNEKMAAKSREVCERIEREDAERRSGLSEVERRILEAWPRFEDGGPAWFGDGYLDEEGEPQVVRAVQIFSGESELIAVLVDEGGWHTFLDEGARLKRPAPKVLDADGVEIKVGDTVWTLDGLEGVVTKVEDGAACIAYESDYAQREEADNLTHARPDSWGRLELDADSGAFHYCVLRGIDYERGSTRSMMEAFASDIIRRAKALAVVGAARDED